MNLALHQFRFPVSGFRLPSTDYRSPSTVHRPPSTVHRSPFTDHRLPSTVHNKIHPYKLFLYLHLPKFKKNVDSYENPLLHTNRHFAPPPRKITTLIMLFPDFLEQKSPSSESFLPGTNKWTIIELVINHH